MLLLHPVPLAVLLRDSLCHEAQQYSHCVTQNLYACTVVYNYVITHTCPTEQYD